VLGFVVLKEVYAVKFSNRNMVAKFKYATKRFMVFLVCFAAELSRQVICAMHHLYLSQDRGKYANAMEPINGYID